MLLSCAATYMKGIFWGEDQAFMGAATDTRLLEKGQLFFAWKGANHNGHDFLEQARQKGAVAAVVTEFCPEVNLSQIVVEDPQLALGILAKHWRAQWKGTCIGITGSNGKTTLKEMIANICRLVGVTQATQGNLNNHVGCPLTILGLRPEHQFAVIEMGANHANEIAYLSEIVQPHIAIINNVAPCHLEGFGSLEGIAKAKFEIFTGLVSDGVAILNVDDHFYDVWRTQLQAEKPTQRYISFGLSDAAQIRAQAIQSQSFEIIQQGKLLFNVTLQLVGIHNICNALAATSACIAAGIAPNVIQTGLAQLTAVSGRLEMITLANDLRLVNDAYNANPSSLMAGIETVIQTAPTSSEVWLILGDMKELGVDSARLHYECGVYAKKSGITRLFALGQSVENSVRGFGDQALLMTDHDELIKQLNTALSAYRKVMPQHIITLFVKGSFSMNMQRIVDALKRDYQQYH